MHAMQIGATSVRCAVRCGPSGEPHAVEGGQGGVEGPGLGGAVVRGLSHPCISRWTTQVSGRATGPELRQQVRAACAGPVLIAIACARSYLGRPVPGEDDDRHRRSSFNRRGGRHFQRTTHTDLTNYGSISPSAHSSERTAASGQRA